MREALSDAQALAASVAEPDRFEVVFERHYDLVRRYLQRRIGPDLGEDLAAETFLVAFDRRSSFRSGYESARPWLLGIATNLLRHHHRAERSRLEAYARVPRTVAVPDVDEDALAAAVAVRNVALALQELRPGDRDALLLLAFGDLTYEEIAQALSVPVGTVKSRIHRARRILRERLQPAEAIWTVTEEQPSRG